MPFKSFSLLYTIINFLFASLKYPNLLILKLLTETLLRISFSVIGRCSLVPTFHWLQGKSQAAFGIILLNHRRLPVSIVKSRRFRVFWADYWKDEFDFFIQVRNKKLEKLSAHVQKVHIYHNKPSKKFSSRDKILFRNLKYFENGLCRKLKLIKYKMNKSGTKFQGFLHDRLLINGWYIVAIRTRKLQWLFKRVNPPPPSPTGIGELYGQTITNFCQAALLRPMWTPPIN